MRITREWLLPLVPAAALGLGACSQSVGASAIDDPASGPTERDQATRPPAGGTSGGMNAGMPGSF